jgi:fructan beta-fructosidase
MLIALILLLANGPDADDPRPDIVLADFEGDDYAPWTVTGTAFGTSPARGTLPNQMAVEGFDGRGLANSYVGGDDATGRLTSSAFPVDRPFLNFLIGGGGFPGETCINLMIDGKAVRTATGPNRDAGGSERLRWKSWDVSEFAGKTATLEIVDHRKGGWGHINVDQIALSDQARQAKPAARELVVDRRYLLLPVRTGAPKHRMRFTVGGEVVREFDIELAGEGPSFQVFSDVATFQGQRLRIEVDEAEGPSILDRIEASDAPPDAANLYRERHRPQFHFTSRRGWLNDPNGLVWHDGEYHLFYQHNPYGWDWGNMHWGHAVSPDLVHWKELPIALYPRQYGDWCFSGSGLVDEKDTSGLGAVGRPPLIVAYTSTGRGECLAFSHDRGRTFREPEGNPVVAHNGRDPKVIWHEPTKRWVMAVYDEAKDRQSIAFHTSPDLRTWTSTSRIDGFFECPDLFELPVDGDPDRRLWVLHAADGRYLLGQFDGRAFLPESSEKQTLWHGDFYAAQGYANVPDGRRIQIGWGRGIEFPGMPFNQQMTVPCELTLRSTDDGVRLFANPVRELATLRGEGIELVNRDITPLQDPLGAIRGELFDIEAEILIGTAPRIGFNLRGVPLVYDARKRELTCRGKVAPLDPIQGRIRLRVLLDRGSIEVFGNDGRVAMSVGVIPDDGDQTLGLFADGGPARIASLKVFPMRSAWPEDR